MNINEAISQLARLLTKTKEFTELREAKGVVEANPKSAEALGRLQKKQEQIYGGGLPQEQLSQYMKEAEADYRSLSQVVEIERYFKASESFNRLLSGVYGEINSCVSRGMG
jgi:cell fate (sporulation/competence/biofilm development) regulator YlbF (YheA/YmcA/DUF963 family)